MSSAHDNPGSGPLVKCPGCGCNMRYDTSNPFRPFCSERCRVADFGAWANEKFRIPATTPRDGELLSDSPDED